LNKGSLGEHKILLSKTLKHRPQTFELYVNQGYNRKLNIHHQVWVVKNVVLIPP